MEDPLELETGVRCGLMLAGRTARELLRLARRAETRGYDSLFAGDHVAFHVPVFESLTLLSVLAGATERITLGTAVYLLPLRHPTLVAKATASLDALCGGRFVFGVGVGGEFPPEFDACGVPLRERGSRADEAIGIVRRLWRDDAVRHRGRHFAFGPVSLAPKPARPGGPPIWVGGRRAAALRRAGRLGDGYISHMTSRDRYRSNLEEIRSAAAEAARPRQRFATAALIFTALDDDYEAALERAANLLGRTYNVPFREGARKYCLLGRPADCLEQLRGFVRAGCRHFVLAPIGDPEEVCERIADEMLDEIRALR